MKTFAIRFVPALALTLGLAGPATPQEGAQTKPVAATKAPAAAQEPPGPDSTFPAQVNVVTVDVVVNDKKGVPVSALKKEDFVVTEDGVPQTVVSFDAIQVSPLPAVTPKPRPKVSTNAAKEDLAGRSFVVVFDDINMSPPMAYRAKAAVAEFLKSGTREGDRVLLVATGGTAWWSARMDAGRDELLSLLKRLEGRYIADTSPERLSDYEAMRIHVFHDTQVVQAVQRRYDSYGVLGTQSNGGSSTSGTGGQPMAGTDQSQIDDPYINARATEVYFQTLTRNKITLETIERALLALVGTRGRKSVILVSQGFIYDPEVDQFRDVVQASRRANAAIYFLDTRGLEGVPFAFTAQFGPPTDVRDLGGLFTENIEASEGSESIAADSGGFTVKNSNDLGKGIKRIADESRMYYLLGYNPTNATRDGKFRKIQVKLAPPGDKKGLQIRARKGYYAANDSKSAPAPKPGARDAALQAALDSPFDRDDIGMRMTAYVFQETLLGKAQVLVASDVDVRHLTFEDKDGRFMDSLEFLLVVAHRESGEYFRYDQRVELKLLPPTKERLDRTWYTIPKEFELPAGGYQAKIVVREKTTGRIGTVVHEFDVPDLSQFRVSTPILSDTLQPPRAGETDQVKRPALIVRRTFPVGSMVFCSVDVYQAQKDPKTGMPSVAMGYVLKGADGTTLTRVEPSRIRPTSLGKLSRLIGFSTTEVAPGELDLVLQVRDELSGRAFEQHEPFTVVAASGGAPVEPAPPADPNAPAEVTKEPLPGP